MTNQPTLYKGLRTTIDLAAVFGALLAFAAFALAVIPKDATPTGLLILAVIGALACGTTAAILRGLAQALLDIADNSRR